MVTKTTGTTIQGTGPLGYYTIKVVLPKTLSEPKRLRRLLHRILNAI